MFLVYFGQPPPPSLDEVPISIKKSSAEKLETCPRPTINYPELYIHITLAEALF